MIRSSKHTLKYANSNKLKQLETLFDDYKHDIQKIIGLISKRQLPLKNNLSSKDLPTFRIAHSQWKQIIYRNASALVRSWLTKNKKLIFKKYQRTYAICKSQGKFKKFTNLKFSELNIDYLKRVKINLKKVGIDLNYLVFNVHHVQGGDFDEFIHLRLPYFQKTKKRAETVRLPVKHHRHSLKFSSWSRKNTIRLIRANDGFELILLYEQDEYKKRETGKNIGIDIGFNKLLVDSDGNQRGVYLKSLYESISNKKQRSKNWSGLIKHKNNEIRRVCNELKNQNYENIFIEDLTNLKQGKSKNTKKFRRKSRYWAYSLVIKKLDQLSETEGFRLIKINPAYTSQMCSGCGNVDKENRNMEIYQCSTCGFVIDADHNAAINILHRGVYNLSNAKSQQNDNYVSSQLASTNL